MMTALAGKNDFDWKTHKKLFMYCSDGDFIFAKSLLFMNDSGQAVYEAFKKFDTTPDHLVVLHDESDLPVGNYKISFDRSSGGQKGVQSIIDHIGTQAFWRVRIGIRPASENVRKKAGEFVLSRVKKSDEKIFEKIFEEAAGGLGKELATH
jgi:PTH1 family peptidyl-tRNA hydrolase